MNKSLVFLLGIVTVSLFALTPANAQTFSYGATLLGVNEVSSTGVLSVGDADGSAQALVTFDTLNQTVTYSLSNLTNLDEFRFWHIHTGAAGVNGPILVDFGTSLTGTAVPYASVGTNVTEVSQIIANPGGHYFNAHTSVFPGGAVRA
ncbi:MAG: CHRD domain-containing protein, partial [Fibrella sp.]|nr:CHRD domain-containing protein [Armatimonadota bacterium]